MTKLPFRDRADAAHQLAAALTELRGQRPLVLAIPRGAVPMGRILAESLQGELDIVLVRKLGAPGHRELAVGAVDESGWVHVNAFAAEVGADSQWIADCARHEGAEIRERRRRYTPGRLPLDPAGRIVVVVDDGLATGTTMIAALHSVRARHPARLICAVPVAAAESLDAVRPLCDEIVCLATPSPFLAVGHYYTEFGQVEDETVIAELDAATPQPKPVLPRAVHIDCEALKLPGDLAVPAAPRGLVLFAHGSGSSRLSPRNRHVARLLQHAGFATLLMDLLSPAEEREAATRFDIDLLWRRLAAAVHWVGAQAGLAQLPLALFGASTGAAAALELAARMPRRIAAVVARGGRPDLARPAALGKVQAPVLLLVGELDDEVLALNRAAQLHLQAPSALIVVPGATHLFEEAGALDAVAVHATDWFRRHLLAEAP